MMFFLAVRSSKLHGKDDVLAVSKLGILYSFTVPAFGGEDVFSHEFKFRVAAAEVIIGLRHAEVVGGLMKFQVTSLG